jgi:hypothetical protein
MEQHTGMSPCRNGTVQTQFFVASMLVTPTASFSALVKGSAAGVGANLSRAAAM